MLTTDSLSQGLLSVDYVYYVDEIIEYDTTFSIRINDNPQQPIITDINDTLKTQYEIVSWYEFYNNEYKFIKSASHFIPDYNGIYLARYTEVKNCVSDYSLPFTYSLTSIHEDKINKFQIKNNTLQIPLKYFSINNELLVTDILGNRLYEFKNSDLITSNNFISIDFSAFDSGVYLFLLKDDNKIILSGKSIK